MDKYRMFGGVEYRRASKAMACKAYLDNRKVYVAYPNGAYRQLRIVPFTRKSFIHGNVLRKCTTAKQRITFNQQAITSGASGL